MATIASQLIDENGLQPTMSTASAGGDNTDASGNLALFIKNGSAGAITVNIISKATPGPGETTANYTFSVPNDATGTFKKLGRAGFVDPVNNLIAWTYSASASITVAVLKF